MTKTYRGGTMKRAVRNVLVAMLVLGGAAEAGTMGKVAIGVAAAGVAAAKAVFSRSTVMIALEAAPYVVALLAVEKAIETWREKREER